MPQHVMVTVVLLGVASLRVQGWQLLSNATVPSYLSSACSTALTQDVAECNPMVSRLIKGYFYPESTLQRTCSATCDASLAIYEETVASACGDENWNDYFNAEETGEDAQSVPVRLIPSLTRYLFDLTCLEDSGRWCNVVAGTAAMLEDPGSMYLFRWCFCGILEKKTWLIEIPSRLKVWVDKKCLQRHRSSSKL